MCLYERGGGGGGGIHAPTGHNNKARNNMFIRGFVQCASEELRRQNVWGFLFFVLKTQILDYIKTGMLSALLVIPRLINIQRYPGDDETASQRTEIYFLND